MSSGNSRVGRSRDVTPHSCVPETDAAPDVLTTRPTKVRSPVVAAVFWRTFAVGQWRRHRGSRHSRFYAGKKINGRKPFIVTDTLGLLIVVSVVAASTTATAPRTLC